MTSNKNQQVGDAPRGPRGRRGASACRRCARPRRAARTPPAPRARRPRPAPSRARRASRALRAGGRAPRRGGPASAGWKTIKDRAEAAGRSLPAHEASWAGRAPPQLLSRHGGGHTSSHSRTRRSSCGTLLGRASDSRRAAAAQQRAARSSATARCARAPATSSSAPRPCPRARRHGAAHRALRGARAGGQNRCVGKRRGHRAPACKGEVGARAVELPQRAREERP